MYGFLPGLRPGTALHVFFAPGGCNASVITDVVIPDYLPPTFTDASRIEAAVTALSPNDVRYSMAIELHGHGLLH